MLKRDEIHWFPLRIRHSNASRLLRLQALLDEEPGVERTFIPMRFKKVAAEKMDFAPAVDNLLFIRVTYDDLSRIKEKKALYEPIRYIMRPVLEPDNTEHSEVLYVADAMMDDFIRVTSEESDKVVWLDNLDFACKPSQAVQITEGQFAGVKGRIKRIQGNVCVVIPIEQTAAVAIRNLPRKHLRYLSEEESARLSYNV